MFALLVTVYTFCCFLVGTFPFGLYKKEFDLSLPEKLPGWYCVI